jgi:hypothetical protein
MIVSDIFHNLKARHARNPPQQLLETGSSFDKILNKPSESQVHDQQLNRWYLATVGEAEAEYYADHSCDASSFAFEAVVP